MICIAQVYWNSIIKSMTQSNIHENNYLIGLQLTYDNRLQMYNEDSKQKRAKSKTTLVFNANIKAKIKI